jgi:hypothetical protein
LEPATEGGEEEKKEEKKGEQEKYTMRKLVPSVYTKEAYKDTGAVTWYLSFLPSFNLSI